MAKNKSNLSTCVCSYHASLQVLNDIVHWIRCSPNANLLQMHDYIVSDLLELITPSDHEESFQSVIAITYSDSECVYAFTRLCVAKEGFLYLQEPHPGNKLYPEQ